MNRPKRRFFNGFRPRGWLRRAAQHLGLLTLLWLSLGGCVRSAGLSQAASTDGGTPARSDQQPLAEGRPSTSVSPSTGAWSPDERAAAAGGHFAVTGEPLAEGVVVGSGTRIENLTVFPILAAEQPDFGPITSLDRALADATAEVREIGAADRPEPAVNEPVQQQAAAQPWRNSLGNANVQQAQPRQQLQSVSYPGGGAQVGKLVIDNKGEQPIYVLAGTVVKGGKQDRQIGQDVIIPPKSVIPVDAFCVEQGRWTAERQGVATGGKFRTISQLATSKVRAAAQYEGQQGKVWEKVAEVNQATKKSTSSGTLLATLDAPDLQRSRDAMRRQILTHLEQASPRGAVVGIAYAVDGKVQGVRWFANHQILGLFRDALANTAAFDALTAQAAGSAKLGPVVAPTAVRTFVASAEAQAAAEQAKQTAGGNENRYSESDVAFSSKTTLGKPGKPKKVISKDYLAK